MGNTYQEHGPQGQPPQVELYPGSIENWRSYWFKYCSVRSLYDRQSQVRNWVAPEIPTVGAAVTESYAAPIYWVPRHNPPVDTGYKNPPVPVYRCKPGAPVFKLETGRLERGLYVFRVIGAVPTEQLRSFREPLYLEVRVNDGPNGEDSFYRVRLGYVDEFYSIGEVFFYASEWRVFRATVSVGAGSKVDLLVHNISLDDVLAGHVRGALKKQVNLPQAPRGTGQATTMAPQQRLARDAAIWENFPPVNAQGAMLGTGGDEHLPPQRLPGNGRQDNGGDQRRVRPLDPPWSVHRPGHPGCAARQHEAEPAVHHGRLALPSPPDKVPGHTLRDLNFARNGWKWTGDPRFAFIIKHYMTRDKETDAEWKAIEDAAATVKRAPWLDNRSRVMPMWAGVLETGLQHDDRRFRAAAYVRLGFGIGHAHNDSLDLQVSAHGLPATIDGGQRGGYSRPGDANSRVHNVVEADGKGNFVYSWAKGIADAPGARWLSVDSMPPIGTRLFRRQRALIDVDPGAGSQPLPPAEQIPFAELPQGVTPANAYVFDVFRVSGGKTHTYCFHGPVDDEFVWNVANSAVPAEGSPAAKCLGSFNLPEKKLAGAAPETLVVTWRQHRDSRFGSEQTMQGPTYRDDLPRHHTRLHLLGVKDALAMKANLDCFQWKYDFSCLTVQKTTEAEGMDSAFPAVVEPYRGEPFIASVRQLAVSENGTDAERAVAVEVKTVNGHTDVCFADGRPEKERSIEGAAGAPAFRVAGEAAFCSSDANGLRQATIVGGTLLEAPGVKLVPTQRERTGKVVKVDYLAKTLWIDEKWPAVAAEPFEIGVPGRTSTYTAVKVEPDGPRTRVVLDNGADFYRAQVEEVDEEKSIVTCALGITMTLRPGIDKGWVVSGEAQTHFWRADYLDNRQFQLTGAPVKKGSFGKANALRLWEYGVGDTVRQSTFASLRRIGPAEAAAGAAKWELTADVAVEVTLPDGRAVKVTETDLAKAGGTVRLGAK
jgi:hypothetical protein